MAKGRRILVVDDEEPIRKGLARVIAGMGHEPEVAADAEEALETALREPPDLVITDLQLPGRSGLDLVHDLKERGIESTLIVLTAHGTIDSAVQATRSGVYDYLVKPVESDRLTTVIEKGLERAAMRREVLYLRREMVRSGRFQELVGRSPGMLEIYRLIEQVAPSGASVLITGESGTGKEVVARTLHRMSTRSTGPFVAINCAAIPETLLESEILGHEKGAFTGATTSRAGCFELAHKGTLLLDEIAEMPPGLQTKLLRVLEDQTLRRVGGTREIPVDARVIASTNAPIGERLASGRFREELYFRLNVFTLAVPPLRERREDLPLLAQTFLTELADENGKEIVGFSEEAMRRLVHYHWPGNVRELRNAVQRAVIVCKEAEIQATDLPPTVRPSPRIEPERNDLVQVPIGTPLADVERVMILETLRANGGNKTRTAAILGISAKTLHNKLRVYRQ
ncbi:MAG: response regulator [Candidatus Eisenbacteria bacterium]|nr:response regulator [Candidatus Latescibacterota bacterium]MBD3302106.1 response regulator [Candidatus Eisenbacteria bacterium]